VRHPKLILKNLVALIVVILVAVVVGSFGRPAWAAQPIAYITEIQRTGGDVQVRVAAEQEWKTPRPLLALSAGDQLRVSGQARLVVLYHADGRSVTVTAANSPFTVTVEADARRTEQARVFANTVAQFFLSKQSAPQLRQAATRGDSVLIVSPRHTRLLPGPIVFEWDGPDNLRYGVRVVGPDGIAVWTQTDLPRAPLSYPTTAPALVPGLRYTWELDAVGRGRQPTSFEIVTDAEAVRVRGSLAELDRATQSYPRATLAVTKAAVLYEEGLFAEARRELEQAAASDPREATVRFVLGHVYEHIGLSAKAARAFDEANDLIAAPGR